MKTIKHNGHVIQLNYDGSVIYVNGRLAKTTFYDKLKGKSGGYYHVKIGSKNLLVHRLVAMAYLPNPQGKKLVLHKDTKTTNNHYTNLAWGDQKDIVRNMLENNRTIPTNIKPPRTLTDDQIMELWRMGKRPHEIANTHKIRLARVIDVIDNSRAKLTYIPR
jgi:hypothetical protein